MAACELKRNRSTQYASFYVDNSNDLDALPTSKKSGTGDLALSKPCCMGSIARDSSGKNYTLTSQDKWVAFTSSSGGGGGGGGGISDDDIATESEVEDFLDDMLGA